MADCPIELDPLPPHSNPQALKETQIQAFTDSKSVPPDSLGNDDVYSTISGLSKFRHPAGSTAYTILSIYPAPSR